MRRRGRRFGDFIDDIRGNIGRKARGERPKTVNIPKKNAKAKKSKKKTSPKRKSKSPKKIVYKKPTKKKTIATLFDWSKKRKCTKFIEDELNPRVREYLELDQDNKIDMAYAIFNLRYNVFDDYFDFDADRDMIFLIMKVIVVCLYFSFNTGDSFYRQLRNCFPGILSEILNLDDARIAAVTRNYISHKNKLAIVNRRFMRNRDVAGITSDPILRDLKEMERIKLRNVILYREHMVKSLLIGNIRLFFYTIRDVDVPEDDFSYFEAYLKTVDKDLPVQKTFIRTVKKDLYRLYLKRRLVNILVDDTFTKQELNELQRTNALNALGYDLEGKYIGVNDNYKRMIKKYNYIRKGKKKWKDRTYQVRKR